MLDETFGKVKVIWTIVDIDIQTYHLNFNENADNDLPSLINCKKKVGNCSKFISSKAAGGGMKIVPRWFEMVS